MMVLMILTSLFFGYLGQRIPVDSGSEGSSTLEQRLGPALRPRSDVSMFPELLLGTPSHHPLRAWLVPKKKTSGDKGLSPWRAGKPHIMNYIYEEYIYIIIHICMCVCMYIYYIYIYLQNCMAMYPLILMLAPKSGGSPWSCRAVGLSAIRQTIREMIQMVSTAMVVPQNSWLIGGEWLPWILFEFSHEYKGLRSSSQLTHSNLFQRGGPTTNQSWLISWKIPQKING